MFRDNSLIPAEAVRLAALGLLAEAPRRYGELALEIRHFTSHVVGPSLDLMGTSLELLRYEGLVAAVDGEGMADNAVLRLTERGRAALDSLLRAQLRAPVNDLNRLALLLKLRFLHHLPAAEQQAQLALMAESLESEQARLEELLRRHGAQGIFAEWLGQDVASVSGRIAWLKRRSAAESGSSHE
jgi:DNA-binding PadR family transcriptional regulator